MTFGAFKDYIEENILSDWMEDARAVIQVVKKNNGVEYVGLYIKREGQPVTPAIYLDAYFDCFLRGETLDCIVERIRKEYQWAMSRVSSYNLNVSGFDFIKDRIIFRLVNYEKNKEILSECPFVRMYDLAVTFRWIAHCDDIGVSTALVTNQELELWRISLHDLLVSARRNTCRLFPPKIISMENLIEELSGVPIEVEPAMPMYIMTNDQQINGATVLLYDGVLQNFAGKLNSNIYILPSSIHEMILIPEEAIEESSSLFLMVREANDTVVSLGDVLSDGVYYYNLKENKVIPLQEQT